VGHTGDVVLIEGSGFDPRHLDRRTSSSGSVRVRAWREANEIEGRDLKRNGRSG
jgi:hypothetical protein